MSAILLPQVVIKDTLESLIKLVRDDLKTQTDEKQTLLYKLLGETDEGKPLKMNQYNYFKQAKKMFETQQNLSVNFGYNLEVAKIIALHILLPAEQGRDAAIGEDEGYMDEEEFDDQGNKVATQQMYTQMYDSTYQIMITSENSTEVDVVYSLLKSLLLMVVPHLELLGLRIPKLSGNDILMQDDLVPIPIFHKVLNISFTYELTVPKLVKDEVAKRFFWTMRILDYYGETEPVEIPPRGI